jgi:hypothetical protein
MGLLTQRHQPGPRSPELFDVRRTSLTALVLFLAGLAAGVVFTQFATASSERPGGCRLDARPMARLELLFGTGRPNGAPVDEADWAAFLDGEVTPRFPDGLTVLSGPGQWRGQAGRIERERAIMLVIWYAPSAQADAAIEAIRSAYQRRFEQESVMRIDGVSCVSF